jgi:ferric-dicitrate binding protein FerR (iron transport regulator)
MKNDDTTIRVAGRRKNGEQEDTESMVEHLLSVAGASPEIPEDGAERVKGLIRPVWRAEVASHLRQRNRLWLGGLAAAAALIIVVISLPGLRPGQPGEAPRAIAVARIEGSLEVTPPSSQVVILNAEDMSSVIPRGSLVRTGPESRAAIWLGKDTSLRLDVGTALRVDSAASISLDSGAIYIDAQNGPASGVEVRTALGTATDIGTQFEVRLEHDTLGIKVREGAVSLTRGEEDFRISPGVTLSVASDGEVVTGSITPFDPSWSWTQAVAPPFEIEDQTVMAFLDWVSSETGLTIGFENPAVERLAATTILHGSIEGLSPREAPSAILPSCRLSAVERPGALLIRRMEPGD